MIQDTISSIISSISSDVYKSKFGTFYNLFILPAAQILDPLSAKIKQIDTFQGLLSPMYLSESQMNTVVSNFGVFRNQGAPGTASVNIIVRTAQSLDISQALYLTATINGISYPFIFPATQLQDSDFIKNYKYGNYYSTKFPVPATIPVSSTLDYTNVVLNTELVASQTVDANIVSFVLSNMPTPSVPKEDNMSLYYRFLNSAGSRTLDNEAGVLSLFADRFPDVYVYKVFGNTDQEVIRNQIYVFSSDVDDSYNTLNFKGKFSPTSAIPHKAYEYLLTSDDDYVVYPAGTGKLQLTSYLNYLYTEASPDDYAGLPL